MSERKTALVWSDTEQPNDTCTSTSGVYWRDKLGNWYLIVHDTKRQIMLPMITAHLERVRNEYLSSLSTGHQLELPLR